MATAKRLPSGSYRVRVYDKNTGKYKSFTAETKKAARANALTAKFMRILCEIYATISGFSVLIF